MNENQPVHATKVDTSEADKKRVEHEKSMENERREKAAEEEAKVEAVKVAEAKAKRLYDDSTLQTKLNKIERALDA